MRLYRLCEHEGQLDFGAYRALKSDVTLGEALELEAALCVIGDQRAEFSEFYQDYKKRTAGRVPTSGAVEVRSLPAPTTTELRAELDSRRTALERLTTLLSGHRRAVAMAASGLPEPAGRIDAPAVAALEASLASHHQVVSYLTKKLEENGE